MDEWINKWMNELMNEWMNGMDVGNILCDVMDSSWIIDD